MDYPLSGLSYIEPTRNTQVFAGTYTGADYLTNLFGYNNYYWVSFRDDGTLSATPQKGSITAIDKEEVNGTWSLDGTTMTINVYGESYTGTKYDVAGAGFGVSKSSTDKVAFAKENDYQLSPVSSSSIVGLWFTTNDYGKNFGFRFLSDGTCYVYQSDGTTSKRTWALSSKKTKILIEDYGAEKNIALSGNYLYLATAPFQKVQ